MRLEIFVSFTALSTIFFLFFFFSIPDAGPLIAAVKTACGREPLVVGKPNAGNTTKKKLTANIEKRSGGKQKETLHRFAMCHFFRHSTTFAAAGA